MKKIVRILAGLVMGLMCVNCASARSGNEEKVSETRSVNPFLSIPLKWRVWPVCILLSRIPILFV